MPIRRDTDNEVGIGLNLNRDDWRIFRAFCKELDISATKGIQRLVKWAPAARFMPGPAGMILIGQDPTSQPVPTSTAGVPRVKTKAK